MNHGCTKSTEKVHYSLFLHGNGLIISVKVRSRKWHLGLWELDLALVSLRSPASPLLPVELNVPPGTSAVTSYTLYEKQLMWTCTHTHTHTHNPPHNISSRGWNTSSWSCVDPCSGFRVKPAAENSWEETSDLTLFIQRVLEFSQGSLQYVYISVCSAPENK